MKFIADAMLGRLARWLRLLGWDTLYFPSIEDSRLLRIAREENRILLTRDTRLVKVRDLKQFLLLKENDPFDQLRTVVTEYNLYPGGRGGVQTRSCTMYSRCSLCNTLLENASPEQAAPFVPDYVYKTATSFKKCPCCSKFYWKGSHHEKLRKKLNEILYNEP